jgi:hypothetical protein
MKHDKVQAARSFTSISLYYFLLLLLGYRVTDLSYDMVELPPYFKTNSLQISVNTYRQMENIHSL